MAPDKIQPEEYSTGGGIRLRYGWRGARSVSVGNVNRDERDWNANVNSLANGNRWNADNRLLVRNKSYFLSLPSAGVFFSTYALQPMSILLASTRSPAMRMYCAFVMALLSQPTSRKNLATSSLAIETSSTSIFCCPERYPARNACSSVSRRAPSMRVAIVCRRTFWILFPKNISTAHTRISRLATQSRVTSTRRAYATDWCITLFIESCTRSLTAYLSMIHIRVVSGRGLIGR